jgi:hypothetical protein
MCSGSPKTPDVVRRDPVAEAQQSAAIAAKKANKETAAIKRRQAGQKMETNGGMGYDTALESVGKKALGD